MSSAAVLNCAANFTIRKPPAESRPNPDHYYRCVVIAAIRRLVHAIVYEYCDSPYKHGLSAALDTRKAVVDTLVRELSAICDGRPDLNMAMKTAKTAKTADGLVPFLRGMFDRCVGLINDYNRCAADKLVIPVPSNVRMPYEPSNPGAPMYEADPYIQRVLSEMAADNEHRYLVSVKNT